MKTPAILLIVIIFVLSSFSPPAKSYTYESDKGKISAAFPSEFESSVADGESYSTIQVTCTLDEQSYLLSYTIYETAVSKEEGLEGVVLTAFANAIGGDILSKEKWTTKGLEGVKARMYSEESTAYVDYIVVFKGDIQYQFACYALENAWNEKKAKAFFKTIQIQ